MRLRFFIFWALLIIVAPALLCATPVFAQSSIGVVDAQMVLSESVVAKKIAKHTQEYREKFFQEISAAEHELRELESQLGDNHAALPPEEFARKKAEFEEKFSDTRKLSQRRKRALDEGAAAARARLNDEFSAVVTAVAKERGFSNVIARQQVFFYDKDSDITAEVLRRLDESGLDIPVVVQSD